MPPELATDPRAMLGDFETSLWIPLYREGRWGDWSLRLLPATSARGYWGSLYTIAGAPMLTGPCGTHGARAARW